MRTPVLAAGAVLVLVTACGSARDLASTRSDDHAPAATPQSEQTPSDPVDKRLPRVVGAIGAFSSPSRNIGCTIDVDGARCDIRASSFIPPGKPATCHGAWGHSLSVDRSGATFGCVTDTTTGAKRILAYGTSTVIGRFGCTSARTGVTCLDKAAEHGFVISRERAGTF